MVVQWLGLWASEVGKILIPGQGTKILHTMWCGQKKRRRKKEMVLVDADGVTIDPLNVRRVLQRVTEGGSVGMWWAVFVGPGSGRGCMAEIQMFVSHQEGRMENLVPWCFMEGLMDWRSQRNAEESQEEMYIKTSQIKGLYTHGTLSQVLVARNNSAFRRVMSTHTM